MIFIRRFLAFLFAIVFFAWFAASTVRSGVDNTLLDADFIEGQLVKQDVYNWLLDDLLSVGLEEQADVGLDVTSDYLPAGQTTVSFASPDTTRDEALKVIRDTFPASYLQQVTDSVLSGIIPYARGDTDNFEIDLGLHNRVAAFFPSVREAYVGIGTSTTLVEELIAPAAAKAAVDFTSGPFGLTLTASQAEDAARRIAPPEWIDEQVFKSLDSLEAYLSGRSDDLNVNISFRDRVPIAAQVTKDILDDSNAEQVIFDTLVKPRIQQQIGRITFLSYGVPITDEDITAAIDEIAPRDWVRGQMNGIVDAVAAYMARETETLTYTVELADRRDAAIDVVGRLAVAKAREQIDSLPQCGSTAQALSALNDVRTGQLPACIDSRVPTAQILDQIETVLVNETKTVIGGRFPDSVTYDETLFTNALSPSRAQSLDDIRTQIHDGITINVNDVLKTISNQEGTAQRILDVIRTGRPYTVDDFLQDRVERQADTGNDQLDFVDTVRGGVSVFFGPEGAAIVILVGGILLLIIGWLGGRALSSKLMWASSALVFSALVMWIAFSQVLSGYGADRAVDELTSQVNQQILDASAAGDPIGMWELARDDGIPKARAFADAVTAQFADYALLWLFIGLLGLVAGFALGRLRPRRAQVE